MAALRVFACCCPADVSKNSSLKKDKARVLHSNVAHIYAVNPVFNLIRDLFFPKVSSTKQHSLSLAAEARTPICASQLFFSSFLLRLLYQCTYFVGFLLFLFSSSLFEIRHFVLLVASAHVHGASLSSRSLTASRKRKDLKLD